MSRVPAPPWWLSTAALIASLGIASGSGAFTNENLLHAALLTFCIFAAVHVPVWIAWRAYRQRRPPHE